MKYQKVLRTVATVLYSTVAAITISSLFIVIHWFPIYVDQMNYLFANIDTNIDANSMLNLPNRVGYASGFLFLLCILSPVILFVHFGDNLYKMYKTKEKKVELK